MNLPGKLALKMWESGVSFQSTCVLATAATSRANPGWSGNDETVHAEESGKEGNMRESEKIESRGSSDALRLPRPKIETAAIYIASTFGWKGIDG